MKSWTRNRRKRKERGQSLVLIGYPMGTTAVVAVEIAPLRRTISRFSGIKCGWWLTRSAPAGCFVCPQQLSSDRVVQKEQKPVPALDRHSGGLPYRLYRKCPLPLALGRAAHAWMSRTIAWSRCRLRRFWSSCLLPARRMRSVRRLAQPDAKATFPKDPAMPHRVPQLCTLHGDTRQRALAYSSPLS